MAARTLDGSAGSVPDAPTGRILEAPCVVVVAVELAEMLQAPRHAPIASSAARRAELGAPRPAPGVLGRATLIRSTARPDGQATKYFAWGWWHTIASVVCSGCSWNPSETVTPIRSASSSAATVALSVRSGHAG